MRKLIYILLLLSVSVQAQFTTILASQQQYANEGSGPYTFTDADAEAYSDAIDDYITVSDTQKEAIDDCVIGLKADGAWTLNDFINNLKLNNASANAINMKNPATFTMTFVGGLTHSATGVTGNGSTGYAYNGYIPSAEQGSTTQHFGIFIASNNTPIAADALDLGSYVGGTQMTIFGSRNNGSTLARMNENIRSTASTDASGDYIISRTGTNLTIRKNGTQIVNGTGGGTLPNLQMYYWNLNAGGSPYADGWSNQTYTALFGGDGLDATQADNTRARINALLAAF